MFNQTTVIKNSKFVDWNTPKALIEELEKEFGRFDLDPCCNQYSCIGISGYDIISDGLKKQWWGKVFVNPPYTMKKEFIIKAFAELSNCELIVFLLPANTCDSWFHEYFYLKPNVEIRFLRRLKFWKYIEGDCKVQAPMPLMLCIVKNVCCQTF